MSAEHTPTPWRVGSADIHAGAGYRPVMIQSCWIDGSMDDEPEAIANRALIVEAVNSHAGLLAKVAALTDALEAIGAPDEILMTSMSGPAIRGWAYAAAQVARDALRKDV